MKRGWNRKDMQMNEIDKMKGESEEAKRKRLE